MELKSGGYKQTEVGRIPEDWDCRQLSELTRADSPIRYGIVQPGPYVETGIPVLAIKNLNTDYHSDVHRSSSSIEKHYNRSRVLPGDILLSVKGTTGRVGIVPEHFHGNISRDLARIRLSDEDVPAFYFQLLQSDMVQRRFRVATVGTTRSELSIGILKQIKTVRPPKDQQSVIASTLSDVDALIASLDKLIAKKRDIKRAAMQQLLTGRRRLPGFGGEWDVVRIDEHASIKTGSKNTEDRLDDGEYPFFVRSQEVERINSYSYDGEAVLTAGDGVGTGKVFHYVNGRFDVHQRVYRIAEFSNQLHGPYFFYLFSTRFYDRIMSLTAKSSVDSVRMEMIAGMEIPLPSPGEQRAIATVLSDMDAQIAVLEARRDKTHALKLGMMQELLTGRIRLV